MSHTTSKGEAMTDPAQAVVNQIRLAQAEDGEPVTWIVMESIIRQHIAPLEAKLASQTTELVNLGQAHGVLLTERSDLTDEVLRLRAANVRLQEALVSDPTDQSEEIARLRAVVEHVRQCFESQLKYLDTDNPNDMAVGHNRDAIRYIDAAALAGGEAKP